jgi:ABC-type glycerol-3-phosphate transport system substrate-binding protein
MRLAVAALVSVSLFAACGGDAAGSEAFCEATRTVVNLGDVEELPPEVDTMVEEAPDEIADAAETVRTAFEDAFENSDLAAIQTEDFQAAATELREYAVENCEGLEDITE